MWKLNGDIHTVKSSVWKLNGDRKPNTETGLMESLGHTVHGRDRERVKTLTRLKNNNSLYIECAQRALIYKFIRTKRSIDTYFNAHK